MMGILYTLSNLSLIISLVAIFWVYRHWRFLSRADKSLLRNKVIHVLVGEGLTLISILLYGINILINGPDNDDFRELLKFIQILGVAYSAWALSSLTILYSDIIKKG